MDENQKDIFRVQKNQLSLFELPIENQLADKTTTQKISYIRELKKKNKKLGN